MRQWKFILEVGSSSFVFFFWRHFLRRETPQQSFHFFFFCLTFYKYFQLSHVSYTNISHSQSLCHKVSTLVLSSTQSRIVSLYNLFCSWMKSLFWSYLHPEQSRVTLQISSVTGWSLCSGLISTQNRVQTFSQKFISQCLCSGLIPTQSRVQTFSQSLTQFS